MYCRGDNLEDLTISNDVMFQTILLSTTNLFMYQKTHPRVGLVGRGLSRIVNFMVYEYIARHYSAVRKLPKLNSIVRCLIHLNFPISLPPSLNHTKVAQIPDPEPAQSARIKGRKTTSPRVPDRHLRRCRRFLLDWRYFSRHPRYPVGYSYESAAMDFTLRR